MNCARVTKANTIDERCEEELILDVVFGDDDFESRSSNINYNTDLLF